MDCVFAVIKESANKFAKRLAVISGVKGLREAMHEWITDRCREFTEVGAIIQHPHSARDLGLGHCSVESITDVKCWGVF